jgi:hypothetical protein
VILEIFLIDDGGSVEFTDRRFRFAIGLDQPARDIRLFAHPPQQLNAAKVAAGVQIGRMSARSIAVIIYDCYSTSAIQDWILSVARLRVAFKEPCIVLAAPQVDEDL